ncbi:MAG: EAL domain-containing protein [Armatimonadota bacterium]|nr:EAL domain-containing protein [Armatimonadota bacterium]
MAPDIQELIKVNQRLEREMAERERIEEALQQARDQLQAVLDAVPGAISWVSADLTYLGVNKHLASVLHLPPESFIGKPLGFLHNSPAFNDFVHEFFSSTHESASREVEIYTGGAEHVYLIVAQKYQHGQAAVFVGIDISERKQVEQQLVHDAFHDKLTGLANRALFMDRLGHSIARVKRYPKDSFAVLFIDLDRFKVINDSLGHMIGDQLLIAVARRLETCLRPNDTVARLGGDEFAILLGDIREVTDATTIADRIQKELALPFHLVGQQIFTSASIGIALSASGYDQPEILLRDADTAMYRAKALGKACYAIFDTEMHAQAMRRMQLETDLRRALERQEFVLQYQPIIALDDNKIKGFEALVRWEHPQRGLILPQEFIPIAEETGLIVPLDHWVLREACHQMSLWQEQSGNTWPLTVSINLSRCHFAHPDFVEQIKEILHKSGIKPESLHLEITERALIEHADVAAVLLGQLRALGIRLSLDDFGTGYSSLNYLHRFPLAMLKVDGSLINRLGQADEDIEILRTIVALSSNLGIDVVAEGVETEEQLAQVRALRCEYAEGYVFSQPVDGDAAAAMMMREP